jgi:hypothetical protein
MPFDLLFHLLEHAGHDLINESLRQGQWHDGNRLDREALNQHFSTLYKLGLSRNVYIERNPHTTRFIKVPQTIDLTPSSAFEASVGESDDLDTRKEAIASSALMQGSDRTSLLAPEIGRSGSPPRGKALNQPKGVIRGPIKVAILKDQLKLLRDLESFLRQNSSPMPKDSFSLWDLVAFNAAHMFERYAHQQFGVRMKNEWLEIECRAASFLENTPVDVCDDPAEDMSKPEEHSSSWSEYVHWAVLYPPAFCSASEMLERFINSPLLPPSLNAPLRSLTTLVHENVAAVRNVMNECASMMPTAYPTADSVTSFQSIWVWNRFNKHSVDLFPAIRAILDRIKKFYQDRLGAVSEE